MIISDLEIRVDKGNLQDELKHKLPKYLNKDKNSCDFDIFCEISENLLKIHLYFEDILEKVEPFSEIQTLLKNYFSRIDIDLQDFYRKEKEYLFVFKDRYSEE